MSKQKFQNKQAALKEKKDYQILAAFDCKGFHIFENYPSFITCINPKEKPRWYEYIFEKDPVNFFFDIEIKKKEYPNEFNNFKEIIEEILKKVEDYFKKLAFTVKIIVLKSHTKTSVPEEDKKISFHVIFRLRNNSNHIYFKSVHVCKTFAEYLFPDLTKKKIIDCSVYREGCFRTLHSSKAKKGTKESENRPLIRDEKRGDQDFEDIDTFVQYTPLLNSDLLIDEKILKLPAVNEKKTTIKSEKKVPSTKLSGLDTTKNEVLKQFVNKHYSIALENIYDIKYKQTKIVIGTKELYCHNKKGDHQSNHQYILIDSSGARRKCHDSDCKNHVQHPINFDDLDPNVKEIVNIYCRSEQREKIISDGKLDAMKFIRDNYDEDVKEIEFDEEKTIFYALPSNNAHLVLGASKKGNCENCKMRHSIDGGKYCFQCSECLFVGFPRKDDIFIPDTYNSLKNFINFNNNSNISITNIIQQQCEDFSCDVALDIKSGSGEFTSLCNQILDGHKPTKIAELLHKLDLSFVYSPLHSSYFTFTGSIWKPDKEFLKLRLAVVELASFFDRIQKFYDAKQQSEIDVKIIKNLKALIVNLNKAANQNEIFSIAKSFYEHDKFHLLLNSKKHIVPFTNGVYDLLQNSFRQTKKEDYITLTLGYDFDPSIKNQETIDFVQKVLPDQSVRDYVLKKMSECLNGDIPNTNFLMFIGDGANGKSQLLNLMKITMGELGEKVEVTLLTRKRNNAEAANPEKMKLMYKRFAFLSEPEDNEKINIGLLKELTGSEEIVARGLYQGSQTFVMETKLFLACNQLPEVKGEDPAIWRRVRIVNFPSRFVEEPKELNEFLIDRSLPARIREDISWRQTFLNILLDYYHKKVQEPESVKVKTNEYREDNNEIESWCNENITLAPGEYLEQKLLYIKYFQNDKTSNQVKNKMRNQVEVCFKKLFPTIDPVMKQRTRDNMPFKGWTGIKFI
jgi:P4 family phage/plasmid primase-like protien